MKRILILGGGFGGVSAAHALRSKRPDDEIVLVDRRDHFMVGFRKSWGLIGEPLSAGQAPLRSLEQYGITFVQGEITEIDPQGKGAIVDGNRLEGDAMLIALGAQLNPQGVEGLAEYGHNVYDPAGIEQAADALRRFERGRVVFGIFGVPYKCPPAPYEMAILTQEALQARGVNAHLTVFSPQPVSMPILGAAGCATLDTRMIDYGILFLASHKATKVDNGEIYFENGRTQPFDLLLGVPPHKVPQVLVDAGLTGESGWVKVNLTTMQTGFEGVYAVGDCIAYPMNNGQPLPKAGVFAEAEGITAAEQIAAMFDGRAAGDPFEGTGGCFLEMGSGEALLVRGHFLAEGGPQVSATEPTAEQLDLKRAFEAERLEKWFGMVR